MGQRRILMSRRKKCKISNYTTPFHNIECPIFHTYFFHHNTTASDFKTHFISNALFMHFCTSKAKQNNL